MKETKAKKRLEEQKAITLIALVITIIVLLILAAVSIATLTGENGILTQASNAKEQNIIGREKEEITLAYTTCKAEDMEKLVDNARLKTELEKNQNDVQVIMDGNDLIIWFKDTGHRYTVNQDGKIEQIEDLPREEAYKIVDVILTADTNKVYVLTAMGEVRSANIEEGTDLGRIGDFTDEIITTKGIRKKGKSWFIDNEGKLYTWGGNRGDGTKEYENMPICISDLDNALKNKNIVDLYEGESIRIAKDEEGKLYTWGENYFGLGDDEITTESSVPIGISDKSNSVFYEKKIMDIKMDNDFSGNLSIILRDNEGKIYTWGRNNYGQLGNGTTTDQKIPSCISNLNNDLKGKNIVDFYTNGKTILARDNEGKIYTWGRNAYGELGDGTTTNKNKPICISDLNNALKGKNIVKILNSSYSMIVQDDTGKIYAWGDNDYGQLGDGTTTKQKVPICISNLDNDLNGKNIIELYYNDGTGILARDNEGKIYTWGRNNYGLLGDGTTTNKNKPICISNLDNDLNGKNITKVYDKISNYERIVQDSEGKIYTWGRNNYGQLGDGTNEDKNRPMCISDLDNDLKGKNIVYVCSLRGFGTGILAIDNEGKIYTWGGNKYGECGDGTKENRNTPICISNIVDSKLKNNKVKKVVIDSFSSMNYRYYITESGETLVYIWNDPEVM